MAKNLVKRALKILKEEGILAFSVKSVRFLIRQVYLDSNLHQSLPKNGEYQTYNDVIVEEKRVGDRLLLKRSNKPSYESQFVEYIRDYVEEDDFVVVIGGYYGVSTITAATQAGNNGSVITFEATPEGADRVRKTARLNHVKESVTVKAAAVGPIYNPKGRETTSDKISPEELPNCDVLAIDCDGCELDVLNNINIEPRMIIVEHHGELYGNRHEKQELDFEYQRERLDNILSSKGYDIIEETSRPRKRAGFDDQIGWFVAEKIR